MTLNVLIVDDEALARSRLKTLLADLAPAFQAQGVTLMVSEAAHAVQAVEMLTHQWFDVTLLDIHMPGADGLTLAGTLRGLERSPAVVFVTAYAQHAVQAFELEAVDYLTKPVRLERLEQALLKVRRRMLQRGQEPSPVAPVAKDVLLIQDRLRTERLPLDEIVYLKAELKYVTVRTARRSFIWDGSLQELEDKYKTRFLRVHRNALVSRLHIRALVKHFDPEEGEGWAVRLDDIDELLAVSRRQLAAVRSALAVP